MKRKKWTRLLAVFLSIALCLQMSGLSIFATEAAYDPTSQIDLTVPEALLDGSNYFFIRDAGFSISEKSAQKLLIPVQRAGNTEAEAEVSLKVADITARYGVNYTAKIYDEKNVPEIINEGMAVVDIVESADDQEEYELPDENEAGQILTETGGADFVTTEGVSVGRITADALDENGSPVRPEESGEPAADAEQPAETAEDTAGQNDGDSADTAVPDGAASGALEKNDAASPQSLRLARNLFTGTASDRQAMEGSDTLIPGITDAAGAQAAENQEEAEQDPGELVEESYPGREYRLHFEAGETAKYLVIDPKYSEASDGDCIITLILKDEQVDYLVPEEFNHRGINIVDEDEPEEVRISMASAEVVAENGEAAITVTREGAINDVVGVMMTSYDGTATMGEEYGGVGAKLYFPMGIRERTIELPVGHGTEQKDFNVTITPLKDETIGTATTHVIIPSAAEAETQAALMEGEELVDEPLNLRSAYKDKGGYQADLVGDTGMFLGTVKDEEFIPSYINIAPPQGYAYDGVQMTYRPFVNWCYAKVQIEGLKDVWYNFASADYKNDGALGSTSLTAYYDAQKAPSQLSFKTWNYSSTGAFWFDSHVEVSVDSVQLLKRKFTVQVDKAEPLDFAGVGEAEENRRVAFMLDDKIKSSVELRTGDNFSISKLIGQTYTQLKDVVAVGADGSTFSLRDFMKTTEDQGLSYSAGMSDTFTVILDEKTINYLGEKGCISWTRGKDGSYAGSIHVRPVFDYTGEVTVSVRDTPYGNPQVGGKSLENKKYHLGDRLTFTPNLEAGAVSAGVRPCGMGYLSRKGGASGKMVWRSDCDYFIDDQVAYDLTTDYYEFWQVFTETHNNIQVQVPTDQLEYFDTEKGLFRDALDQDTSGTYTVYTMKQDVLTNELTELWAAAKDEKDVPVWTMAGGRTRYSGNVFYFYTDAAAAGNVVTLTLDRSAENHADYSLSGSVCSAVINIATGLASEELIPTEGASVMMGTSGTVTDENGAFTLQPQTLVGDTTVRYLISYNGIVSLREARVAPATAAAQSVTYADGTGAQVTAEAVPVTLGAVQADSFSPSGAHFTRVEVEQQGILGGVINVLEMNGKEVTVKVHVDPGESYVFNGKEYSEEIKDVTLYFQNQLTGEIHGTYSTSVPAADNTDGTGQEQNRKPSLEWDAEKHIATLHVKKFSPDDPEEYTYGDVLLARLSTDKRTVMTDLTGQNMVYDPVSTGVAVISDRDYEPETFDYELDVPTLLEASVNDDGELMDDAQKRYSFGKFPYLGEITAAIRVFTFCKNALKSDADYEAQAILDDVENIAGDGLAGDDAELMAVKNPLAGKRVAMAALLRIKENPYGGVRVMIAVVATMAAGSYERVLNPREPKNYYAHMMYGMSSNAKPVTYKGVELIQNQGVGTKKTQKMIKSELSGPYARFSLYVGLYFDFGYIEESTTDGSGTRLSHHVVFMGAGGFIGGQVGVGYTWQMFLWGIPCYVNLEGNVGATLFLGSEADPQKTLEEFQSSNNHAGADFRFNVELSLQGSLGFTFGLGLYKTFGIRATASVGAEVGYNLLMPVWYENAKFPWGFTTNFTISGAVDVVVCGVGGTIDLGSASWPLPWNYGYMAFFQQARRGTVLLTTLYTKVDDIDASQEVKDTLWSKILAVGNAVDHYAVDDDEMENMVDDLRDYAYDHGFINWFEKQRVNMCGGTGLIMNIWDTVQLTDWDDLWNRLRNASGTDQGALSEDSGAETVRSGEESGAGAALLAAREEQPTGTLHRNAPVASRWVAGENGELMSAFGAVSSEQIVEDAVSQPSGQIMSIGGDRYLMVFLSEADTEDGHVNVLMYSIYNAATGRWEMAPQKVQDEIGDNKPSLTDAGDRLILTWASESREKYDSYKKQIQEQGMTLEEAAMKDPAGAMRWQDIFVAEFDKATGTFTGIEQITDDAFCDDFPQAVYDSQTGDYIVLYYKTAQDTDTYGSAESSMLDMIGAGADPEKTYSVLAYMLYNNQTGAEDSQGRTHEPGWARDYLFANETDLPADEQPGFLKDYGGQRFLSSALRNEDGSQTDPPITDLTVAPGYNGLAAFAFTVDKDSQLTSVDDRELYVQFYDFEEHATYVPVKIAGEEAKDELYLNGTLKDGHYETREVTEQVNVGSPKLIRNEGSTWLFWRQGDDGLRYVNISELLNVKVGAADDPDGNHAVWAVQSDGSFAVDPRTGKPYEPDIQTVDFGTALTSGDMNITDYQVITDQEDNLYVVWTDTTANGVISSGKDYEADMALEIYATAKIREKDLETTESTDTGEVTQIPARWSRPYRLTRDNKYNDGVAIALADDGDLLILHNQYEKLPIDSEEKLMEFVRDGKLDVEMIDGQPYVKGSMYYNSPISLMFTRCEPIGSVEATQFFFSDETPEAGETVEVTALLENSGLTSASACRVEFYEYKDGRQVRQIASVKDDSGIAVNSAKKTTFEWTVPSEGVDGCSIQAVVSEKKSGLMGGWYPPVESFSDTFREAPDYELSIASCVQNGDEFDVEYTVANNGNQKAGKGTEANLYLQGLYGDLQERYGMEDDLLVREDISGLAPGETRNVKKSITLPVSVFRYCGYDAVQAVVYDPDGNDLIHTDHYFITLDEPLNLTLNGGSDLILQSGQSAAAPAAYDSTVFMDLGGANATKVVYSVDDPAIAAVDADGNVTGLGRGTTTLTATLMPSGRTASVKVRVQGSDSSSGSGADPAYNVTLPETISSGSAETSASRAKAGEQVTITVDPEEGYRTEAVNVTDADGNPVEVTDNGDGTYTFTMPASGVQVNPVFVKDDGSGGTVCPRDDTCPMTPFTDAEKQAWYHDGVHWAIEKGIMNGTAENIFEPLTATSRGMIVTMLWRMEGSPQVDDHMTFKDVPDGAWYTDAVKWAAANGVVNGYSEEAFGPDDDVTREQIVTILYRYAQFKGVDVSQGEEAYLNNYTDARDVSEWAVKAFRWAVSAGVIQGMTETTLSPKTNAVRAQTATMFMRYSQKI